MEEDKQKAKSEGTFTMKKSTLWMVGTFVFAGLFLLAFFGLIGTNGTVAPTTGAVVDAGANPTPSKLPVKIDANDPILGDPDASITIVEYSDFQCPFCERAYSGAVTEFKQSSYFKNGEVNLVYKQFPLNSIHPQAQKAAEASLCAGDQGKFWEYHDTLFENQASLDIASLKSYAVDLGLDSAKFNSCLDKGDKTAEVNAETTQATNAGGRGTPYFVIINEDGDTVAVSGAVPFANFESAINSLQ